MKIIACLLFLLACFLAQGSFISEDDRDGIGSRQGEWEVSLGQFPWHVSIVVDRTRFCSGALIATDWVLTAAQCVAGRKRFTVSLGSLFPEIHQVEQTISDQAFAHPMFDPANARDYNIALIKLVRHINLTDTIDVIGIESSMAALVGQASVVSGWGNSSSARLSPVLLWSEVNVVGNLECSRLHSDVNSAHVCASPGQTAAVCPIDVGGALVYERDGTWIHLGVASNTSSEGFYSELPAVFTRTSPHALWIQQLTGVPIKSSASRYLFSWLIVCIAVVNTLF